MESFNNLSGEIIMTSFNCYLKKIIAIGKSRCAWMLDFQNKVSLKMTRELFDFLTRKRKKVLPLLGKLFLNKFCDYVCCQLEKIEIAWPNFLT